MDGYSVKDAAIVLGIPERRIWELLARGVLAGAPEGPDGMIVFLQPRSTPASTSASQGAASGGPETAGPKPNGNGGSPELSPFRELLTEFRNLTERYGQALLALGEARGEVASLRSRVDLLEARMDLRLPSSPPPPAVAWELPEYTAQSASTASTVAFEGDPAEPAVSDELEDSIAGEDEPAAEPMIDPDEEATAAEVLQDEELVDATDADEAPAEEPVAEVELDMPSEIDEPPIAEAAVIAELMGEGAAAEPEAAPDEETVDLPEPPQRRARGGRTATAGFAAALARAHDPTPAELPGAEETAAALAALQREIDASQAAEPVPEVHAEPEVAEASELQQAGEAVPEAESVSEPPGAEETLVDAVADGDAAPEPSQSEMMEEAAADEPQPSVPSYYSTDVVEPDWFADGDFSWLEAAQAEGMQLEPAQPVPAGGSEVPADGTSAASVQEAAPDPVAPFEPEMSHADVDVPVADDIDEGAVAVAGELAFGDHPDTDAARPDVGHEGFEPSVESQAIAEEEARAAIQDAFDEAPGVPTDAPAPAEAAGAVALATAAADVEAAPEAESEAEPVIDESGATDQQPAPTPDEPAPAVDVADGEVTAAADVLPGADEPAEPTEASGDVPTVTGQPTEESVAADSYPQAFETEPEPADDARSAAEHEADVEAEAIQDAFEEPAPMPDWPAAATPTPPAFDSPPPSTVDDAGQPAGDDPPPSDPYRAANDGPPSMAAVTEPDPYRGPEEFIAPAATMTAASPPVSPATPSPSAVTAGEEELMWLGDEFEAGDLEVAAEGWRSPSAAAPAPSAPTASLELSDAELAQLAEDEGWDLDEVEAIRRLLGRPSDAPPPDAELDRLRPTQAQADDAVSAPDSPEPGAPPPPATTPQPNGGYTGHADEEDPEWLQGRSGAAADAYRRLRKLFPS